MLVQSLLGLRWVKGCFRVYIYIYIYVRVCLSTFGFEFD